MGILWSVIALGALGIIAGILGWIDSRRRTQRIALGLEQEEAEMPHTSASGGCCGMHMTCERDSLLAAVSPNIVYYDDEELDRYQENSPENYTSDQAEEFREVLLTLDQDEVAGWIRSLQLRNIALPSELLPEVYLIIGESRAYHMEHGPGHGH